MQVSNGTSRAIHKMKLGLWQKFFGISTQLDRGDTIAEAGLSHRTTPEHAPSLFLRLVLLLRRRWLCASGPHAVLKRIRISHRPLEEVVIPPLRRRFSLKALQQAARPPASHSALICLLAMRLERLATSFGEKSGPMSRAIRFFGSLCPRFVQHRNGLALPRSWTLLPLLAALQGGVSASTSTQDQGTRRWEEVHEEARVVDLHVDPLLWNRDLLNGSRHGQVDLPKLRAGRVDAAVFGIVTAGLPFINGWRLFTLTRGYERSLRRSRWAMALDQIRRLEQLVADSAGRLALVRNSAELANALAKGQVAAFLSVEGAQALEGVPSRVRTLHARGVLSMGLVHLSGNEVAGASYPLAGRGGVTSLGYQVIEEMARAGMWIDLAHLSKRAFFETLEATRAPVFCSHTGVSAVERSWRNLDDDQLRAIAARDGVVGIMLATQFIGGHRLERWVAHVRHAVEVMGVEHVAVGSDMDGFVGLPREVKSIADMGRLTRALLEAGFSDTEASQIMGGNFVRMLQQFRPGTASTPAD